MSKHKVLKILAGLSPLEVKKFGMFLRKTNGRKETLLKLFDTLRKYHPDFEGAQLEHRDLYRNILPGKAFHEKRISHEMSELQAAVEQFMIEEYLQEHAHSRNAVLLQAYKVHQLDDFFFSHRQKMEKALEDAPETSQVWLDKMKLADEYYYHPSTKRITGEAPSIHQAMASLDHYYAIAKLQYACEALNRQNVLQDAPVEIRLLEEVRSILNFDDSVCLRFYALALALLEERADETYRQLKAYFKANFRKVQPKDRLIIFSYLLNHVAYNVKKGVEAFNQESIELYRFGVDHEIMIVDGYFDVPSFENIVATFSRDEQYEWTLQFIRRWGPFLKQEIRANIVINSEAHTLFEQGRIHEAYQKMDQNERLDFHDDIRASLLLIRCYVELKYDRILINKCESFSQATRRSKIISEDNKTAVLNFVKIVKHFDKPGLNKASLLKELSEMKSVFYRNWLTEKIGNL